MMPAIPKILHFCWFGGLGIPAKVADCLASWRRVMPDFEIMHWYDKCLPDVRYLKTAMKCRRFGNVSDYMRFYVLDLYGGIYLDTDVEVLKSFEALLSHQMFMGWQPNRNVNGAVMGAVRGHPLVRECLNKIPEVFNGSESCAVVGPKFVTEMVASCRGLDPATQFDELTDLGDITIYPSRYFFPYMYYEEFDRDKHVTPETICLHRWHAAWMKS